MSEIKYFNFSSFVDGKRSIQYRYVQVAVVFVKKIVYGLTDYVILLLLLLLLLRNRIKKS